MRDCKPLEGKKRIQNDLKSWRVCANNSGERFNLDKCKVIPLGNTNIK